MEQLVGARIQFEKLKATRNERERVWEEKCVVALSRATAVLEQNLSKSTTGSQVKKKRRRRLWKWTKTKIKDEEVKNALQRFYSVHNRDKLGNLDKVTKHFHGRFRELNEALMIEYGADLTEFLEPDSNASAVKAPASLPPPPSSTPPLPPPIVKPEASTIQAESSNDVEDMEVRAKKLKNLFMRAVEEFHLPFREYLIQSSAETSMFGIQDLWLEVMHGQVRVDLSASDESMTTTMGIRRRKITPVLGITTEKPLVLKCKVEGLRSVDSIHPSLQTGKGLGRPFVIESVEVNAQVEFALVFEFHKKRWRASPKFKFHLAKLKTNKAFADPILRSVMNATVPGALKKAFEKNLGHEIGSIMIHSCAAWKDQSLPMGLAMQIEVKLEGWPSAPEFAIDLASALARKDTKEQRIARNILKKLNLKEEQLRTLDLLNKRYKAQKRRTVAAQGWQRGVFPLKQMSLEELVHLRNGLFVGDLVGFDVQDSDGEESVGGSEYTAEDEDGDTLSQASDNSFSATVSKHSHHKKLNDTASLQEPCESDFEDEESEEEEELEEQHASGTTEPSNEFRYLNEFKNAQDSDVFAKEYSAVISAAVRAQAEAQAFLDEICDTQGVERWRLAQLVTKVESKVMRKSLTLELHVHAVDLRVNLDVTSDVLRATLWQQVKDVNQYIHEQTRHKQLRSIHDMFKTVGFVLAGVKALASKLDLTVTGAVTGGRTPAFELSVKDISSEGVIDLQLSNLRLGGLFKEFSVWFLSFAHLLRQGSAMSRSRRRESALFLSTAKEHMIRHLELVQFFLDVSLRLGEDASLIVSLAAQKENPRPAFSVHLAGDLKEILEFFHKHAWTRPVDGVSGGFAFPFEGSCVAAELANMLPTTVRASEHVIDIAQTVLRDEDICRTQISVQEAFWVYGFAKFLTGFVSPSVQEITQEDAALTDDDETSSVSTSGQ